MHYWLLWPLLKNKFSRLKASITFWRDMVQREGLLHFRYTVVNGFKTSKPISRIFISKYFFAWNSCSPASGSDHTSQASHPPRNITWEYGFMK